MARWIQDVTDKMNDPRILGYTIVAGWWPTTYHRVFTAEFKVANLGPAYDKFVTVVHRTDRVGVPKHQGRPVCEVKFDRRSEALRGHRLMVQALAEGRRHLIRLAVLKPFRQPVLDKVEKR